MSYNLRTPMGGAAKLETSGYGPAVIENMD
jgi:hypothetical protein